MKKNLLLLLSLITINLSAQDCSDLFISEYVEGPGNNNAIEIYNPTSNDVNLDGYTINRYGNGSQTPSETWPLSGSISSGDAISIGNGQLDSVYVNNTYWSLPVDPVFYSSCDYHCSGVYPTPFYFNGDDAITLEKAGNIIDIFGKVGEDPGSAWTDDATAGYTDANGGSWITRYNTLVRKADIKNGITMNPFVFNPTAEYDTIGYANYTNLGTHNCDCIATDIENKSSSYLIYPNPTTKGNTIYINSKNSIKSISLYNSIGQKILETENINFDTSNLFSGTYIIKIKLINENILENKIVIK